MKTPLPLQSSSSTREAESQWSCVEDGRRRRVVFEDAAKRLLRYLEDSEDLKVGISELKEQLETPEVEGSFILQIAQQARNEKGQKIFDIFRQGEEGGVHFQFGEMEHATEESSGTGEAMSRHDAGSETVQRKTSSSEGRGGRQRSGCRVEQPKSTVNRSLRR